MMSRRGAIRGDSGAPKRREKPELRRMQELALYDVSGDKELLARIDAAVSTLTISELKTWEAELASSLRQPKT
ncbi:MAG: hypothetical protein VCE43_02440 [Myxococcota bacterium]